MWSIGLSPWIVQDGNYGEFERGSVVRFALEFYAEDGWTRSESASPILEPLGSCRYRVTARVIHASAALWVIDFGTMAYAEGPPPDEVRVGGWVDGEIYLGVDHFAYFEWLHADPGAPPLIRAWYVERIEEETGPYIEKLENILGRPTAVKAVDESRITVREVEKTDCWSEDAGEQSLHYVLHCRRLDEAATRARELP